MYNLSKKDLKLSFDILFHFYFEFYLFLLIYLKNEKIN